MGSSPPLRPFALTDEPGLDASIAIRMLRHAEALPSASTGALVLGPIEQPFGIVLVERNRICWAAAPSLRRRFSHLLRTRCSPPLEDPELESIYDDCRSSGRPLGEVLVEQSRLTPASLHAALKRHTAESLFALEDCREHISWIPHRGRGYSPRYTFAPCEILADLGAVVHGASLAGHAVMRLAELDAAAVAFIAGDPTTPVALSARALTLPVRVVMAMASWASSPDRSAHPDPPAQLWWREGELICVARCDQAGLPLLVAGLRGDGIVPELVPHLPVA